MNEAEIRSIAVEAAQEAISQLRKTQKRGRKDTAGGDSRIGFYLTRFRTERGLSVSELASDTGLHPTTVGKIEAGQRGMSLKTFARIAYRLDNRFTDDVIDWLGS